MSEHDHQMQELAKRPQRWMLPTMSWWKRSENWQMIAMPFALAMGIMLLVVSALDLPWWAAGLLAAGTAFVSLGVVERYIRVRFAARRKITRVPDQGEFAEDARFDGDPPSGGGGARSS